MTAIAMKKAWMVWLALLLSLAGCGGGTEEMKKEAGHSEEAAEEHAGEEHGEGMAEEGVLTVDAEALRDLQLTTFPAELRPGGEGVTAGVFWLGDLQRDVAVDRPGGTDPEAGGDRLEHADPGRARHRRGPAACGPS